MIETTMLLDVFNSVFNWLKIARDDRREYGAEFENAMLAVFSAAFDTKHFLAGCRDGSWGCSKSKERNLSKLWQIAAVKLQRFDSDLANRCALKGEYWADPTGWKVNEMENAQGSLDGIIKRSRELLVK
jgi:hypothetical protein